MIRCSSISSNRTYVGLLLAPAADQIPATDYRFTLAQMYLGNRQPDLAIALLQALMKSGDPEVARRAGQSLLQAQEVQAAIQSASAEESLIRRDRGAASGDDMTRIEKDSKSDDSAPVIPNNRPAKFLKGTVVSVDCSSAPSATVTVLSGTKTLKMRVPDNKHVLVLGADGFSCSWQKQKVAINYHETGDAAGSIVSIEIQ